MLQAVNFASYSDLHFLFFISAEAEDPFKYSTIEVPSVIGHLKNILTQYPDNGQIIKVRIYFMQLVY